MHRIRMFMSLGAWALLAGSAMASSTGTMISSGSTNVSLTSGTFADYVGSGYTVVDKYAIPESNSLGLNTTLYVDAIRTAGGTYDFAYQISDAVTGQTAPSKDSISTLSVGNYTGVNPVYGVALTDTTLPSGTNFQTPTSTGVSVTAGRPAAGTPITFTFATPIAPGATSEVILVQTTATNYDTGGGVTAGAVTAGNGSTVFANVPEVSAGAVPEPGSIVLGGLAMVIGAGAYHFRRMRGR